MLPSYATIGVAAPIILIILRLLQGLALGGEYGGAATYVAEHAPDGKRGLYTSWIQTTATLGLFLSLLVILGCRIAAVAPRPSRAWGWRIPFLLSIVLLVVSVYIRLQLNESPVFQKMKAEGKPSKAPLTEAFGQWDNLKIVMLALLGATAGQAVVWYTGQFYALFFLKKTLKIDSKTANLLMAGCAADRHAVLRRVRRAVGPHRPQEDHHGRLPARGADLLPDLQGADALREPGAGIAPQPRNPVTVVADRRGLQLPVRPGRQAAIHQSLRPRQGRAGAHGRAVLQRECAGPQHGADVKIGSETLAIDERRRHLSAADFKTAQDDVGARSRRADQTPAIPRRPTWHAINYPMVHPAAAPSS